MNLFRNVILKSLHTKYYPTVSLYTSSQLRLKEIVEKKEGNSLIIEGVKVPSPRRDLLIQTPSDGPCRLCSLGLDVKHTDVLILSQFLRSDGCMLPRRITGLCKKQQRKVSILVAMAQKAVCSSVLEMGAVTRRECSM